MAIIILSLVAATVTAKLYQMPLSVCTQVHE